MKKEKIFNVLSWIFGSLFALTAQGSFSNKDILLGLFFITIAILLIPPTKQFILKKFPKIKKKYLHGVLLILLLGLIGNITFKQLIIKVNLDNYEIEKTYTIKTDSTVISGTARGLDSITITTHQIIDSLNKDEEFSAPVTDNKFSIQIPTRNIQIGKNIYAITSVDVGHFGSFTFKRNLTKEEQEKRDIKKEKQDKELKKKLDDEEVKKQKYLNSKEGRLCTKNPTWSKKSCELIAQKEIAIGMTKEQVIASWGKPKDINTTTYVSHTKEQWVYHGYQYLYFLNNILETIQQ